MGGWFPRRVLLRFNLPGGTQAKTSAVLRGVWEASAWGESFHFRHFSSDFSVGLAGLFSLSVGCFRRLLPHRGPGGFLQLPFLGRFLRFKKQKEEKKKRWVKQQISPKIVLIILRVRWRYH